MGFRTKDCPLEVQLMPVSGGALIVSVCRLDAPTAQKHMICFADVEQVIDLSHLLAPVFKGLSVLYVYEGWYYLFLQGFGMTAAETAYTESVCREFGDHCAPDVPSEIYVREHGRRIGDNIVSCFSRIFE